MKIAIKANPSRGEEILSLLESFGGIKGNLKGDGKLFTYYIDENHIIRFNKPPIDYKIYTLEKFETQFPFKIGDTVLLKGVNQPYKIVALELYMDKLCYELDNGLHYGPDTLIIYKKMKEERNITLTLDKAKEWYKKGGELKEIALQAFTEKELDSLPRSWEEYCRKHKSICFSTRYTYIPLKYDALLKLEQLRDCWRQGAIPQEIKYKIRKIRNTYTVVYGAENAFLSFCDNKTAEEFLECFRDLIEQAGDLI